MQDHRNKIKADVDDAYSNPEKYTPKEIDDIHAHIKNANIQADGYLKTDQAINDDLDKRIDDLKKL